MRRDKVKFVIFRTGWGWFGLAGMENRLRMTILPLARRKFVKKLLLKAFPDALEDRNFQKKAQKKITAYFKGLKTDFSDLPLNLDDFSYFNRRVLDNCRNVRFGQTISYAELAERCGRPKTARAVGNALANNPLPLIVPCHRIIRSPSTALGMVSLSNHNGSAGGFSAFLRPGSGRGSGTRLKQKMIKHEQSF
jgi:O-6-methylguanine DNA methyltransferase